MLAAVRKLLDEKQERIYLNYLIQRASETGRPRDEEVLTQVAQRYDERIWALQQQLDGQEVRIFSKQTSWQARRGDNWGELPLSVLIETSFAGRISAGDSDLHHLAITSDDWRLEGLPILGISPDQVADVQPEKTAAPK